jgi:hypothetical protein
MSDSSCDEASDSLGSDVYLSGMEMAMGSSFGEDLKPMMSERGINQDGESWTNDGISTFRIYNVTLESTTENRGKHTLALSRSLRHVLLTSAKGQSIDNR